MGYTWEDRTRLLLGDENIDILKNAHVLVVGLGGVGAYAAEMICRAGVGKMTIVDGDIVKDTNRNRQLLALQSTEGRSKAELMYERLKDINPDVIVDVVPEYIKDEKIVEILNMHNYDYVVDAIDTLAPKVFLIYNALLKKYRLVSSMGAGGKLNPALIEVADISATHHCPLASFVRKRLHRLGVYKGFKAVFSSESIVETSVVLDESEQNKKSATGTISYLPSMFGGFVASVVIRDLLNIYVCPPPNDKRRYANKKKEIE